MGSDCNIPTYYWTMKVLSHIVLYTPYLVAYLQNIFGEDVNMSS